MFQDSIDDIRLALRCWRANPGYCTVVTSVLGLGIGGVTLMSTTLNQVALRPLPFDEPERLVWVWKSSAEQPRNSVSFLDFVDYRSNVEAFETLAAFLVFRPPALLTGGDEPQRVVSNYITAGLFPMLGVAPEVGRGFTEEDHAADANDVVLLSYALWQERFGASPTALGTTLMVDGRPHGIVGVMPPGFSYPEGVDIWLPMRLNASYAQGRANNNFFMIGRLAPGATLEQAQWQGEAVARRLQQEYPDTNEGWSVAMLPLHERHFGGVRPALWLLTGSVLVVFLVACANVASLALARASSRRDEIGLRSALGAPRGRLARLLLAESCLLGAAGGASGLGLAAAAARVLRSSAPAGIPRIDSVAVDGPAALVAVGLTAVTVLLCGLAPSLVATAGRRQLVSTAASGRVASNSGLRLRKALVVGQVALSLTLLTGAGLLVKSFLLLQRVDIGVRDANVLIAEVQLPENEYPDAQSASVAWGMIFASVQALPGVEEVGAIDSLPLGGGTYNRIHAEGLAPTPANLVDAERRVVGGNYFASLAISVSGDTFPANSGAEDMPLMTVISNGLAQRLWPGENPVGRRIVWGRAAIDVVGVAADVHAFGPDSDPPPTFYLPVEQLSRSTMRLTVHTTVDPLGMVPAVRSAIRNVNDDLPVSNVETMGSRISYSMAAPRFRTVLLASFAGSGLLLSAIGLYGVLAVFVQRRAKEMAIHVAVGARSGAVARMVAGQAAAMVALGMALGMAGAIAATRLLDAFLFGVAPLDAAVLALAPMILAAVSVGACILPAARAARVDPLHALKT